MVIKTKVYSQKVYMEETPQPPENSEPVPTEVIKVPADYSRKRCLEILKEAAKNDPNL